MVKIKYCTDDFLEEYKTNFDSYVSYYKNKEKTKLDEIFNSQENVKDGNIEFDYKPLKNLKTSENPERDNIKIIYDSLKHIKPSHAIQEKLWVAMYNTYYQDHLFDYIDANINHKLIDSKIKGSVVFAHGKKRSLIIQNIARMWWLGYYIYDEANKDDPYHLLEFYTDTQDIVGKSTVFFSSNLTNNKNLRLGILEGLRELVWRDEIPNKREYYVEANKYFNLIGGGRILDLMTREEIKEETINYLLEYVVKKKRAG